MTRTHLITAAFAVMASGAQAAAPLQIKVYNAAETSFNVDSTLVYGAHEALLIDAGFTRADALRIAANVLDSGKQLKTIFISQAEPDYYFGVETLKSIFPQAQVLSTRAVLDQIKTKLQIKLAFWGPKMGTNAPQNPILPTVIQSQTLTVDGEQVDIRTTQGLLANRPYVWIPSIKAIAGNVSVYGQMHVWTADTPTVAERRAWIAQLDEMAALKPDLVVPGHMKSGSPLDASAIAYTKTYLQTFEKNLSTSQNSSELITRMRAAYPDAPGTIALDIGAKVNKGEMKW